MTSPTQAQIPPGWFDDPWNPSGRRWWDGERWTGWTVQVPEEGSWLASDGRYYPPRDHLRSAGPAPPAASSAIPSPPKPGVRRPLYRRVWFWSLVGAVGGAVAIGLWVALNLGPWLSVPVGNRFGLEDEFIYHEDFSAGAGRFDVYVEDGLSGGVEDGKYLLTAGRPQSLNRSLVWFFPSSRVDFRATMTPTDGAEGTRLGLILSRGDGIFYQFGMSPGGDAEVVGPDLRCTNSPNPTTELDPSGEFRLVVERGYALGEQSRITGYLQGRTLVTCEYDDTTDVFTGAGMFVEAGEQPATVTVDEFSLQAFKY